MKQEILKLKDGESYTVPESDYGKAEIWKKNSMYFLFEIPTFGGEPRFSGNYHLGKEDEIVNTINSWN